jgi:hypothetical protein
MQLLTTHKIICFLQFTSARSGKVGSTEAIYSYGPGPKFRKGDRLSWLRFLVVFVSPFKQLKLMISRYFVINNHPLDTTHICVGCWLQAFSLSLSALSLAPLRNVPFWTHDFVGLLPCFWWKIPKNKTHSYIFQISIYPRSELRIHRC